jgi:hypothetical protein
MKDDQYTNYALGILLTSLFLAYVVTMNTSGCDGLTNCFLYMTLGSPYQYYTVPLIGITLSLLPYLFLKKEYVRWWFTFLIVSIPLIILSIITTPEDGTGNMIVSSDREAATYFVTTIYLAISFIIALWGYIKGRKTH